MVEPERIIENLFIEYLPFFNDDETYNDFINEKEDEVKRLVGIAEEGFTTRVFFEDNEINASFNFCVDFCESLDLTEHNHLFVFCQFIYNRDPFNIHLKLWYIKFMQQEYKMDKLSAREYLDYFHKPDFSDYALEKFDFLQKKQNFKSIKELDNYEDFHEDVFFDLRFGKSLIKNNYS